MYRVHEEGEEQVKDRFTKFTKRAPVPFARSLHSRRALVFDYGTQSLCRTQRNWQCRLLENKPVQRSRSSTAQHHNTHVTLAIHYGMV